MSDTPDATTELPPKLTPDQKAAHAFLTELRTRISTQPLPYQYGIEASALRSLFDLFKFAREVMKDNPGCERFARIATKMLNLHLRPLTAKWHRPLEDGRLSSRDGADEFRGDLEIVRRRLLKYARIFHLMAYSTPYRDRETPPVLDREDLAEVFGDVKFGIVIPVVAEVNEDPARVMNLLNAEDTEDSVYTLAELAADFRRMNKDEADEVEAHRGFYGISAKQGYNAAGLALSGGGIRSATFAFGVVQVLAEKDLLKHFDFLSTVSGGGYTGSFLTGWLNSRAAAADVGCPQGPDSEPIRYLRRHARYLAAKNLKQGWSMAISSLGGMLLNLTAPVCAIAFLSIVAIFLAKHKLCCSVLFYVCAVLSVLALVVHGYCMRLSRHISEITGAALGWLTFFTALTGAFWELLTGNEAIVKWVLPALNWHWTLSTAAGGMAAILIAPSLIRYLPVLKEPGLRVIILKACMWGAGLLAPLVALTLFYTFWLLGDPRFAGSVGVAKYFDPYGYWYLWGLALFTGFIAFCIININLTGPHRLYRDGLAKSFVQNAGSGSVEDAKPLLLHAVNGDKAAPYHLLNATVNLPSSQSVVLRDRQCDFFLFSKHWMGAAAVGYSKTTKWRANGRDVDLATAMAVSGAALAPHMGLGGMPTLTALLALLNLRLNFWIKNPRHCSPFSDPGFLCLSREMLGIGMSEERAWLNLSDGGHIENMAVYELLRRRCKFVVCVDGEADPIFTFSGLMTLARHAQIDFGVKIEPMLDDIRHDPQSGLSKAHAHFCRIDYPAIRVRDAAGSEVEIAPAGVGLLLYLKLSVTGNEPELIKRYRIKHPAFPHQSTLDQFFDEEQFEAYRQLGVHVAEGLFSRALTGGKAKPDGIRDWFERLAGNLLFKRGQGKKGSRRAAAESLFNASEGNEAMDVDGG